nr:heat shock cognate 70 kDa protein-like [Tanacetum cinerariifolium]
REATKEAGTITGLNVLRLLNEPTAAAIAYGVDNLDDKQWDKDKNVLVFDLGGETFDVSLLTISNIGDINVKAVGGDTHLGREDFDMTLVNYCIREFMKKPRDVNLRENPRAVARLKVSCEKAKRDSSSTTFAPIEMDCLFEGNDFLIKISRAKFEELNSTYFTKCVQLVEKCLFDGEMKKEDVDEVVVIGGCQSRSKKNIFNNNADVARLSITVYQGEGVKVKDNKLLGMFNFDVLTPEPYRNSGLEVCFSLDINGILLVSAEEILTDIAS